MGLEVINDLNGFCKIIYIDIIFNGFCKSVFTKMGSMHLLCSLDNLLVCRDLISDEDLKCT